MNNSSYKLSWAAWILLTLLGSVADAAEDGGLEGQFLNWGAGARALSMGKAYVAVADDATASYWNPAGLARLERSGFTALHAALWEGITYDFVSLAIPTVAEGAFGFNTTMVSVGGADKRDSDNNVLGGDIRSTKVATGFSYAREIGALGQLGVSVTHLGRWLDNVQTGFFGLTVGVMTRVMPELSLGAVVQNALQVRYGDTEDTLPLFAKAGAAYRLSPEWLLALDVELSGAWHIGMELTPLAPFSVRMGADRWETSAGVGVMYDRMGLDYSAGLHQFLGLSHRFSVHMQWGDSALDIRLHQAREAYFEAVDALKQGRRDDALRAARLAHELDASNEAASWLEQHLTK